MTPEQEAYAIAEQRIAEAKAFATKKLWARGPRYLNLSPNGGRVDEESYADEPKLEALARIPPEIAELTGLTRLGLSGTQVADIAPVANLTALQALYLSVTQLADIAPIANLTALRVLDLFRTQVADIAPVANLTALQNLDLDGTQVADLSPLKDLTSLEEGARGRLGLSYANCPNITDPVLRELAKKDNPERTVETLAYLRRLAEDPPPLTIDDLPDQDEGLEVVEIDGRLDVREGAPTPEEAADPLRRKLHERLKTAVVEMARITGNLHGRQAGRARALGGRLDCPLEDLDLVEIYLDLEQIRLDLEGRDAREGEDRFNADEVASIETVVDVGGGLVLGTAAVEVLEERSRQMRELPSQPSRDEAARKLAQSISQNEEAFGPTIREYARITSDENGDGRMGAVRFSLSKNTIIAVSKFVILTAVGGVISGGTFAGVQWIVANPEAALALARSIGDSTVFLITRVIDQAQQLIAAVEGSVANVRDPRRR